MLLPVGTLSKDAIGAQPRTENSGSDHGDCVGRTQAGRRWKVMPCPLSSSSSSGCSISLALHSAGEATLCVKKPFHFLQHFESEKAWFR